MKSVCSNDDYIGFPGYTSAASAAVPMLDYNLFCTRAFSGLTESRGIERSR